MRLVTTDKWEKSFFERFVHLRNEIHQEHKNTLSVYLPEASQDFKKMLSSGSAFSKNNEWSAAMLIDDGGRVLGRIFASRPRNWPQEKFIPVGYFECRNDTGSAEKLFEWAETWAIEKGHHEVRGPIQGNFFRSYRMRLPGGGASFYGEPVVPDYYHDLFVQSGWSVSGRWSTVLNSLKDNLENTTKIKEKVSAQRQPNLRMRDLDPNNWSQELRVFHSMLSDSFSGMSDFMPIAFEEFVELYDSFRHIMRKDLSFVLEVEGEPVGFMLAYFDPLPIMLKAQNSIWPWRKLAALFELKKNTTNLLIPYVGKLKSRKEVKGVIGILGHELLVRVSHYTDEFLACYIADGSMTFGNLAKTTKVHSQYVLYSKKLG